MNICIAGSRRLPKGQAPRLLIRTLVEVAGDSTVWLRSPMTGIPGTFEQDVANLCAILGITIHWSVPEPTAETPGRASVYLRDIDIIEKVDVVLLFVTPDEAVEGFSGTMHMLEKSLDAGRPTYVYSVGEDGKVERVGEWDEHNVWSSLVPNPSPSLALSAESLSQPWEDNSTTGVGRSTAGTPVAGGHGTGR